MKHLPKTVFTTTLLSSFMLGSPVIANEEVSPAGYAGHDVPAIQSDNTDQSGIPEINKVNYLKTESDLSPDELQKEQFPDANDFLF